MSDENNDWEFELTEDAAPSKKRKVSNKPLVKTVNKDKKLKIEASQVVRKSRRQLAREEGGTSIKGRDIIDPAANWRRGIAFIIDSLILIVFVAIGFFVSSIYGDFSLSIEEFLGPEVSNSIPFDIGGVLIGLMLHFFIISIPISSTQKSFGKKLMKLKILGTMKPKAPLGVIIIREYLAKPLSILSIIGIIMIPLNKKRRGLHDYISGTIVIDNS